MSSSNAEAVWTGAQNAASYAWYTDKHSTSQYTSTDLALRAGVASADSVLDVGAGTGATTEALLALLHPDARIIAVDISHDMLQQARQRIKDPRVSFVESAAEEISFPQGTTFDAIISNAAIWQTDIRRSFHSIARVLAPAGLFAFNISEAFVEIPIAREPLPRRPNLYDLMVAYAIVNHNWVPRPAVHRRPRLSVADVENAAAAAGLVILNKEVVQFHQTNAQVEDWYSIPEFLPQLHPLSGKEIADLRKLAAGRLDPQGRVSVNWLVVTAGKSASLYARREESSTSHNPKCRPWTRWLPLCTHPPTKACDYRRT
jgi:trans-aconitate methyltransferase